MEEALQDYEIAARELRKLCEDIEITARPLGKEGVQLRFHCTLSKGEHRLETNYGAGVGIAHRWGAEQTSPEAFKLFGGDLQGWKKALGHGERTVWGEGIRNAVENTYRPSAFDVVSCLLSDQSSIEPYTDWMDWAEDLGFLSEGKAEDVRRARDSWHEIQKQTKPLQRMFGDTFTQAKELSTQL